MKHKACSRAAVLTRRYGEKGLASIVYSMEAEAPIEATITGSKASVIVHDRAHNPTKLTLIKKGALHCHAAHLLLQASQS